MQWNFVACVESCKRTVRPNTSTSHWEGTSPTGVLQYILTRRGMRCRPQAMLKFLYTQGTVAFWLS